MIDIRTPQQKQKLINEVRSANSFLNNLPSVAPVVTARNYLAQASIELQQNSEVTALELVIGAGEEIANLANESALLKCNVSKARLLIRALSRISCCVSSVHAVTCKGSF